jgi:hypothetical protein
MPYQGYTSEEVCRIVRRSRQVLAVSGILEHITKTYPFGINSRLPLYDIKEVNLLAEKLFRFDSAVAFGTIRKKTRLLRVWEDPEYSDPARDITCPKCGGKAVRSPLNDRIWCPIDDIMVQNKNR